MKEEESSENVHLGKKNDLEEDFEWASFSNSGFIDIYIAKNKIFILCFDIFSNHALLTYMQCITTRTERNVQSED